MDGINSNFPWRLLMRTARRFDALNDVSYSYTDRQVEGILRYSVALGMIMGSLITGVVMRFFL